MMDFNNRTLRSLLLLARSPQSVIQRMAYKVSNEYFNRKK